MLRYLKDDMDFGIFYEKGNKNLNILSYSDSDFFGDLEDRKSTFLTVLSWWFSYHLEQLEAKGGGPIIL